MCRCIASAVAWIALTCPLLAVPARPLYDPPVPPQAPPLYINLTGTTWYGWTYERDHMALTFEAGGKIRWSHSGNSYTTGSWSQDGNAVYIEMNKKYCEFKGHIQGDAITGGWSNIVGTRWSNPLHRHPQVPDLPADPNARKLGVKIRR